MFRKSLLPLGCLLALSTPTTVLAATYTVGPTGRQYTQLSQLFDENWRRATWGRSALIAVHQGPQNLRFIPLSNPSHLATAAP